MKDDSKYHKKTSNSLELFRHRMSYEHHTTSAVTSSTVYKNKANGTLYLDNCAGATGQQHATRERNYEYTYKSALR